MDQEQLTSYQKNKQYILKYQKKMYETNEEYKNKKKEQINKRKKYLYDTCPEVREKIKLNVKMRREKLKLEELQNYIQALTT